jgi:multimeric flavodoxin WrbA
MKAVAFSASPRGDGDTLILSRHFFLVSEMIVPGSSYWSFAVGLEKENVDKDQEGIQTMQVLGHNMAWLMKKLTS